MTQLFASPPSFPEPAPAQAPPPPSPALPPAARQSPEVGRAAQEVKKRSVRGRRRFFTRGQAAGDLTEINPAQRRLTGE